MPAAHYDAATVATLAGLGAVCEFSFFAVSHATRIGLTHVDAAAHAVRADGEGASQVVHCLSAALAVRCSDEALEVVTLLADPDAPQAIDLALVDGDHTDDGARADLDAVFARLAPGGAIVFDDIAHPSHPGLRDVWHEQQSTRPDWLFLEDLAGNGTGLAVRPPLDHLARRLAMHTPDACVAALAHAAIGSEPGAETLLRRLLGPGMIAMDVGAHAGASPACAVGVGVGAGVGGRPAWWPPVVAPVVLDVSPANSATMTTPAIDTAIAALLRHVIFSPRNSTEKRYTNTHVDW